MTVPLRVSPASRGILAAMTSAGVDWYLPPNGEKTVAAPIELSKRSTSPFCEQTFKPASTAAQEAFGLIVLKDMGYDFRRGRQDRSAHPFTTSFTPYDVRITTRYDENDLLSALFSTIHEGGHALYDQGLPLDRVNTPLCQPISLGVHESQSRLWENIIGRSRPFWRHYLPILQKHFPGQLDGTSPERFYRAVNRSRPGLIRVESDDDAETLNPGDSATYRADVPHAIVNAGRTEAVVFLVDIYN